MGSHGTWPGTAGECSGYLVTSGSFHLWLDAGTGTFARLQEHVAPGEIELDVLQDPDAASIRREP